MRARLFSRRLAALACGALLALAAQGALATTITIVNADGPGEGFNDATPVTPVGGNPGTTRGQQRLNVFNYAAQIWAGILPSTVTIRVEAAFDALYCTASSGVLGAAGANEVDANFPNAPVANTWYSIALANKLAGFDRSPGANDIGAQFNSALDSDPNCLGGVGWYYGYDGNEGTQVDLLAVVLHELGHGLGFQTFADESTGALLDGMQDVFSLSIYDKTIAKHWNQMTDPQRVASAINTYNLVWDGRVTTAASPLVLGPRPVLVVSAPPGIAGTYTVGTAAFGAPLNIGGVTGQVVLVDDGTAPTSDACTALVNGAQVSGKIAFIDRGTCTFVVKAQYAQAAGAIGIIIANNVAGTTPPALGGSNPTITIPLVSVTQADGNTIRAQLGIGVTATLKLDPTQYAGADAQGRVLLYAPNPVQPGSSISHFDATCLPNLLMEPAINRDLQAGNVDLTRYLFQDIGWFKGATDATIAPPVTHALDNVPNPFNPVTSIRFEIATAGEASLDVYDLSGRMVKQLAQGPMSAGPHALRWDGTDQEGRPVAGGVYVARLEAGGRIDSHRMVLVK